MESYNKEEKSKIKEIGNKSLIKKMIATFLTFVAINGGISSCNENENRDTYSVSDSEIYEKNEQAKEKVKDIIIEYMNREGELDEKDQGALYRQLSDNRYVNFWGEVKDQKIDSNIDKIIDDIFTDMKLVKLINESKGNDVQVYFDEGNIIVKNNEESINIKKIQACRVNYEIYNIYIEDEEGNEYFLELSNTKYDEIVKQAKKQGVELLLLRR